jgi:Family of unknown function (DUF6448)
MKSMTTSVLGVMIGIAAIGLGAIFPTISRAHCDTLDGPVVTEAKVALERGDVTPVLKWVKVENENEIKTVFKKTMAARSSGKEAKEIADLYFFLTLVRVHRAGEGAAFTGLAPAGTIEPAVAAADKAIDAGSVDDLAKEIGKAAEKAIRERFGRLTNAKKHKDENVDAGREYVEAYVEYVHFVEGLHNTITAVGAHHEHAK